MSIGLAFFIGYLGGCTVTILSIISIGKFIDRIRIEQENKDEQ